ncbi:MAG: hypothetical protein IRZ33_03395 [Alicyclobacillaceae bacterium]|nr:hypothetical protein [Alicyclobacillaceae bacterium]
MADNQLFDWIVSALVCYGICRLFGLRLGVRRRLRKGTQRRRVRVDPLIARERRLAAELREVRAQIQARREGGAV